MTVREIIKTDEYQSVVRDYRMQCLWFTDRGENPETEIQLALASRTVPRDWIDTITCSEDIQPLGLLVRSAASGPA